MIVLVFSLVFAAVYVIAEDSWNRYPGKRYRGKYCYEHHLVWWQNGGRLPIRNLEVIHHINHDKRDNRIENLELKALDVHTREHKPLLLPNCVCSYCKREIRVRPWKLKKKYNFCSRKCIGLFNFTGKSKK